MPTRIAHARTGGRATRKHNFHLFTLSFQAQNLTLQQILPTVASIFFVGADSTDSADSLPILPSVPVFYFLLFCFFPLFSCRFRAVD